MVTSKTFNRLKDARDYLGDTRLRRRAGTLPHTSKTSRTVQVFWEHFERRHRSGVSPSTWASYEHRFRNNIGPALGDRKIGSLNRSDIEDFYTAVQAQTSLDTRRKVQQVLHLVLHAAVEAEWIPKNPSDRIRMPGAVVQREPRALTEAEVEKLANEVPSRYPALVWTFAETGVRPGELLALRVKNLNGQIRIVEATVEVGGRRITRHPSKWALGAGELGTRSEHRWRPRDAINPMRTQKRDPTGETAYDDHLAGRSVIEVLREGVTEAMA